MPTAAPSPRSRPIRSRSAPASPLKSTRRSSIIKIKLFFTPLPSSFIYASFLPCRRLRLFRWRHPPLSPHVAPARCRRRAFSVEHLRRQCPRLSAHRPAERLALAHRCARRAAALPHRRTLRRLHHLFHLRGRRPRPLAAATHAYRRRLPLLEPHRRLRPPLVRPSPRGLIAHGRASTKRHFVPVPQPGAPTRSPRSSAFARATLTSATTFSATAFLLPNGWPCKARTNASSQSPVPSSTQQRAPRCSFAAWRFPCAPMNSARRKGIFGIVS